MMNTEVVRLVPNTRQIIYFMDEKVEDLICCMDKDVEDEILKLLPDVPSGFRTASMTLKIRSSK